MLGVTVVVAVAMVRLTALVGATLRYQSGSMSSVRSSTQPSSGRGRGWAAGFGVGSGSVMGLGWLV